MIIIFLLILTGLLLLVLEFFVFPGMTISGIGGIIMIGSGIYMAYGYSPEIGHWFLALTLIAAFFILFLALRGKTWKRLMLNTEISGDVQTVDEETILPGDKGITITRLNPIGKARVNDLDVEARCPGRFVDPGTEIEVVKAFKTYIIVKPIN
jgi:membrane-bound ClpP family serine protease